jgi:hypothetical protein
MELDLQGPQVSSLIFRRSVGVSSPRLSLTDPQLRWAHRGAMKITLSAPRAIIIAGALIAAAIALANQWTTVAASDDLVAPFRLDRGTVGGAVFVDRWTDSVVECGYENKDDPPVRAGLRRCVYK